MWFMSFAKLPNCHCHLPGCCCIFILRGGGMSEVTDKSCRELYSVRLMWQDSRKMQNLMNTFQLTARASLHMLTSWMWAFTEKHQLKIGLLHVLARVWTETLQEKKVVKCITFEMYQLQNYSNSCILMVQTFDKILSFLCSTDGQLEADTTSRGLAFQQHKKL